jgi:hypothetical protein
MDGTRNSRDLQHDTFAIIKIKLISSDHKNNSGKALEHYTAVLGATF